MKKLLAIAIAAAITAPMAAMADTTVYGKGHVSLSDTNAPGSKWTLKSHASRIGLKGSNALDNGLTATHKFEMGLDVAAGGKNGGLSNRDTWVGLKGGFGEVRMGRHTIPSDLVDDAADFTTHGAGQNLGGRADQAVAYINKFGSVGFAAAHVFDGGDGANDLMVNYSAGPLYAGVGYNKSGADGAKANTKIALAYKGANYGVGFVHGKKGDEKHNTLSGKYSFGKAYVAGQFSKEKESKNVENIFELGYGLGKGTKVYFSHTQQGKDDKLKTNRLGLVHAF